MRGTSPSQRRIAGRLFAVSLLLLACSLLAACGRAGDNSSGASAQGVTARTIKLGATLPFSGPLAVYGGLWKGFDAYVKSVNAQGGVNGRTIDTTVLDDAYDPSRVASNVRKLVQQDKSFLVVDFGAGPLVVRPFLEQARTPQFILGGLAYDARYPLTRSWWPEIPWEASVYGSYIARTVKDPKVATLAINNEVAPALVAGVKQGLGEKASAFSQDVRYEATQVDLSSQINKLRAAGVNALVTLVTGATEIQMLQYMNQINWHPKLFLYSAAVSRKAILEKAGSAAAKGVYSAMWLKDPSDPRWAASSTLAGYRRDVARYGGGADANDIIVANGYAAAQAVVGALRTMDDPTQEGFVAALDRYPETTLDLLQPGIRLKPGPDAHLVTQYQLLQYDGNRYAPVGSPVQIDGR